MPNFDCNKLYSRSDVTDLLNIPRQKGGIWLTGHARHNNDHYIFCNIEEAGRTGHHYQNRFEDGGLIWHTRKGAKLAQSKIAQLVSNQFTVYVFYRRSQRDLFSFFGSVRASSVREDESIEIKWIPYRCETGNEGIPPPGPVYEGALTKITVNSYERDRSARDRCIKKWGTSCSVCDFSFYEKYGELGRDFIHVHHLVPIHTIGAEYQLVPEEDLRPVCPNCHAMLHREGDRVMSIDSLRDLIGNH